MGIAGFYRFISARYPLICETCDEPPEIDNLYIDMNQVLHTCSRNVYFLYQPQRSIPEIVDRCIRYLETVLCIAKPAKLLYIGFDGVAPVSKMTQQRSRRMKAAKETTATLASRKRLGIAVPEYFDPCMISQGTEFLNNFCESLEAEIHKLILKYPRWSQIDVLYSSSGVPGEGEHKILDYVRRHKNESHCIVGLDSDLIILALLSHARYICLLRDEVCFPPISPDRRVLFRKRPFEFLHISLLRDYMYIETCAKTLKPCPLIPPKLDDLTGLTDDFVLLSLLIGNDFVPHSPAFSPSSNGMNTIMNKYFSFKKKKENRNKSLTRRNFSIKWNVFLEFLAFLKADELAWMKSKGDKPVKDFKSAHYMKLNDGPHKVCHAYLKTLNWIFLYYTQGCRDWEYFYPYHYAPFIDDIVKVFKDPMHCKTVQTYKKNGPIAGPVQMMAVFPPNLQHLTPLNFRPCFERFKKYYSLDFKLDMSNCTQTWQGVPLLEFVNLKDLSAFLTKKCGSMTETEKKRFLTKKNNIIRASRDQRGNRTVITLPEPKFASEGSSDFFRMGFPSFFSEDTSTRSFAAYSISEHRNKRQQSVICPLIKYGQRTPEDSRKGFKDLVGKSCYFNFPYCQRGQIVSVKLVNVRNMTDNTSYHKRRGLDLHPPTSGPLPVATLLVHEEDPHKCPYYVDEPLSLVTLIDEKTENRLMAHKVAKSFEIPSVTEARIPDEIVLRKKLDIFCSNWWNSSDWRYLNEIQESYLAFAGSISVTGNEILKTQVGMNLFRLDSQNNPLCLPGLSCVCKETGLWMISSDATSHIERYHQKLPFLFKYLDGLGQTTEGYPGKVLNIKASLLFDPKLSSADVKLVFDDLMSYLESEPWNTIPIVAADHMCLETSALERIFNLVQDSLGPPQLVQPLAFDGSPPDQSFKPGDRVTYVEKGGELEVGTCATVLGVFNIPEAKYKFWDDDLKFPNRAIFKNRIETEGNHIIFTDCFLELLLDKEHPIGSCLDGRFTKTFRNFGFMCTSRSVRKIIALPYSNM